MFLWLCFFSSDAHEVPHRPPDRPGFGPHPGMRGGGDQGKPMFMGEEGKHLRRTLEKDLRVRDSLQFAKYSDTSQLQL